MFSNSSASGLPPKYRPHSKDMTPERLKVLSHLIRFEQENSYPPTMRELADRLGQRSHSTVHSHLESLQRQGLVRRLRRSSRGWSAISGEPFLAA